MVFDLMALGVAVFAAFAWGANEPWAMAFITMAALATLASRLLWDLWRGASGLPRDPVLLPLALFLGYAGGLTAFASVQKHSSVMYFLLAVSCAAILYVVHAGAASRRGTKWLFMAVLILGSFEACYGLIQYLGDVNSIWGQARTAYQRLATGTFINRNHYALLMNMCLCSGLGYLYYRALRLSQMEKPTLRFLLRTPNTGVLLWILLWVVLMGLAVVFSMSRMGIAAMFCSVSTMAVMARLGQAKIRASIIVLIVIVAVLGLAVYVGVDEVLVRFESLSEERDSDVGRVALWKDAWKMIRNQPWHGTGLGTFQWTYPAYESVEPDRPARYAHNDYLQLWAETGIPGLALMLWFFASLWRTAVRNLRDERDPMVKGIGLGSIGVLTAVALQEITDFGLYIPGVAVTATLLSGLNLRAREMSRLYATNARASRSSRQAAA